MSSSALLAGLMLVGTGCKSEKKSETGGDTAAKPAAPQELTIALLLPESKTMRYESFDRPYFEQKVRQLCSECKIIYSNADQDASKQQNQAEAALTNGAKVLVLDPVDSLSVVSVVARARQSKIPVVSYDRLILNADVDYYISFDNEKIGQLQGQALVDKLKADGKDKGTIVVINGSPTDNNAKLYKNGAHSVIDGSGLVIGAEYDTPDWSPDKAQQQMEQAITKLGKSAIAGVYAANDGMAGGAIAAMKAAGFNPLPPVTGQDSELAAIQRVVAGEQYMTIYKAMKMEAEAAAEVAVALARGGQPSADKVNGKVNNGMKDVPSILLTAGTVTKDNVKSTVVADGFWKAEQICEGAYKDACAAAQVQ
ncbi:Solute-binding protein [Stigmatella aurantiaca DW4/3-1]|uniref:Solute-binding protein n=4 Tax=Stigmatella aurantiaca TaxID=41 RepID=E3FCN9_STIAD|nr:Solute-binding protein [Stigmatella aurantiaca DW4/3-1]